MKMFKPTAVKKVLVGSFKTENRDRVLLRVLKGEDDGAVPEEGERISGAKILNHDIVVLQHPSSSKKMKGSSRICPQKRITHS